MIERWIASGDRIVTGDSRDAFQLLDNRLGMIRRAIRLRIEQSIADGGYVTSWDDGRLVVHSPPHHDDDEDYGSQVA